MANFFYSLVLNNVPYSPAPHPSHPYGKMQCPRDITIVFFCTIYLLKSVMHPPSRNLSWSGTLHCKAWTCEEGIWKECLIHNSPAYGYSSFRCVYILNKLFSTSHLPVKTRPNCVQDSSSESICQSQKTLT